VRVSVSRWCRALSSSSSFFGTSSPAPVPLARRLCLREGAMRLRNLSSLASSPNRGFGAEDRGAKPKQAATLRHGDTHLDRLQKGAGAGQIKSARVPSSGAGARHTRVMQRSAAPWIDPAVRVRSIDTPCAGLGRSHFMDHDRRGARACFDEAGVPPRRREKNDAGGQQPTPTSPPRRQQIIEGRQARTRGSNRAPD
jgi:hypothetical protein